MDIKNKRTLIYNLLEKTCKEQRKMGEIIGCTTEYIAKKLNMQRTYVSAILNNLHKEDRIIKIKNKPVIYLIKEGCNKDKSDICISASISQIIGYDKSLERCMQQVKAAMLYPPKGLSTLLLGETGVGKTMIAEYMYNFAVENKVIRYDAPFISFNCADFANNTQLLLAQLFGYKKGAFTGANSDKSGIVEEADQGILFLDEVHRLPPEGQEMLFYLMDKGEFKPLGEVKSSKKVSVLIICATTEKAENVLLPTLLRRIPMVVNIPSLRERTLEERVQMINEFFKIESTRINKTIVVTPEAIKALLLYNCVGNIGRLKSDIQLGCANSFLKYVSQGNKKLEVDLLDFNQSIKKGLLNYKKYKKEVDTLVNEDTKYIYTPNGIAILKEEEARRLTSSFYEELEKRIEELKIRGIDEKDIQILMSIDVENYFRRSIRMVYLLEAMEKNPYKIQDVETIWHQ